MLAALYSLHVGICVCQFWCNIGQTWNIITYWLSNTLIIVLVQFSRASGKGNEETDMWIAYCAFHLGDYKRAMEVSVPAVNVMNQRQKIVLQTPHLFISISLMTLYGQIKFSPNMSLDALFIVL